jgi:hypothetical protein
MARTSSRLARCANSNCHVAKSEPFFIKSMMSNGSIGPDTEPKLTKQPKRRRQSSEAGKVAPTP